ncbi:MAG: tRNA pseudouridine(38-40) synthase TruA [Acidimicrobiales bacterium]
MAATDRWRLDIAYDGAGFSGFAPQPGRRTVVGVLGEALARVARLAAPPYLTGAGRTDTGVHALGQVVSADLPGALAPDELIGHLNALVRPDLVVRRAQALAGFDARRDALWRAYRYRVVEGPATSLVSAHAWAVPGPLDQAAMDQAATALLGEHDFRAFCRRPPDHGPADPLVRRVEAARWREVGDDLALGAGRYLLFDIVANAFCHHQVRTLTAFLVAVGQHRRRAEELVARLGAPMRDGLPALAPPGGLSLLAVGYDADRGGASGPPGEVRRPN